MLQALSCKTFWQAYVSCCNYANTTKLLAVLYLLYNNYKIPIMHDDIICSSAILCTCTQHGFDYQRLPWVFSLPAGLPKLIQWRICGVLMQLGCYAIDINGKICGARSSTVRLLSAVMNERVFGALVQFSCYPHSQFIMTSGESCDQSNYRTDTLYMKGSNHSIKSLSRIQEGRESHILRTP